MSNSLAKNLLSDETEEISPLLLKLFHHPCAPKWNHVAKDRLSAFEFQKLESFESQLASYLAQGRDSRAIVRWLSSRWQLSPFLFKQLYKSGFNGRNWAVIPTMSRSDVVRSLIDIIPNDAPLELLRSYRTAGTTGHPVIVPHCPYSIATYQAFLKQALIACGIKVEFSSEKVACFLIGSQRRTVTYATSLSYLDNSGFAKINLDPAQWSRNFDCEMYLSEFNPSFLTGDPLSFARLLELDVNITPQALITTAVALSQGLREALELRFKCPVIDWYSLTETGPIACKFPGDTAYTVIAPDIYLECLDQNNQQVAEGEIGEIVITGGRNPFLPLLRYRTGDFGRLVYSATGRLQIADLEGRQPVTFFDRQRRSINSVDIAGCLRPFPILQYEVVQHKDFTIDVVLRTTKSPEVWLERLRQRLADLFDCQDLITLKIDQTLGDRGSGQKVVPYKSELFAE